MPKYKTEISPFLIHDPQTSQEAVALLVTHPTPQEIQSLGRLFMIVKIGPASEQTKKIVDLIMTAGKSEYYQQTESNAELAFEATLKKLNDLLSGQLEHVSAEWLNDFHAVVGVVCDQELHFTQVGDLNAYYLHGQRIINILEKTSGAESRVNPLKIFAQTISGELSEGDALVFCSSNILDYLSLDRLRAIVQSGNTEQASRQLESLLTTTNGRTGYAALIIKQQIQTATVPGADRPVFSHYGSSSSQASMDQLTSRESSTNQLLSPSTWKYLTGRVKRIGGKASGLFENLGFRPKKPDHQNPSQMRYYTPVHELQRQTRRRSRYPSRFMFVVGKLLTGLEYIFTGIKKAFLGLINLISGRQNIKQKLQHLPTTATNRVSKPIISFQRLTSQRKTLLLAAVILIFILAQSIIYLSRRDETKKQQEIYGNYIIQAEQMQQDAEASLLYGDEDGARLLLTQAEQLISSIPQKDREKRYQADIAGVMNKIEALYTRTKHINNIADPLALADITKAKEGYQAAGLVGIFGEEIISFSLTAPEIIETNNNTKESLAVSYAEISGQLPLLAFPLNNRTGLIYLDSDTILEYDSVNNTFASAGIEFENIDRQLAGSAVYLNRLYFLDAKNNQIFRHQKAGGNYQPGTSWLTDENIDVKNGVDLAIDGSIYVLRSDGALSKYFQGSLDAEFSLKTIDPALTSATALFTSEDTEYIYILDSVQKRLLVFNKKGSLKNQYTSEAFDNLKDFAVDPANKKAYLLNNTTIYQIDLLE